MEKKTEKERKSKKWKFEKGNINPKAPRCSPHINFYCRNLNSTVGISPSLKLSNRVGPAREWEASLYKFVISALLTCPQPSVNLLG